MADMILTYVPESEHLTYDEALALAEKRDEQAADALELSVPGDEKFLTPDVLITQMIEREKDFRRDWLPLMLDEDWGALIPPLDPRRTWGKI